MNRHVESEHMVKIVDKVKRPHLLMEQSQIANEILTYLVDHPQAQDTLEGIMEWWLLEQTIRFQESQVKQTLAKLVANGLIFEQIGMDLKRSYHLNQNRFPEIKKLID